jgi:hypothetical protein
MRFISTKMHGVLDYVVGVLLIAAPWLFNFNDGTAAQWVPVIIGLAVILMSVMTNYEAGMMKTIPMSTHLTMDVVVGIFLAASPWLFGFADQVYLPHLIVGLLSIGTGLCTETTPHTQGYRDRSDMRQHDKMRHAH